MQSLFSRARTTSQSARAAQATSDEFGRVGSGQRSETLPPLPPKDRGTKDKKDKSRRQRTTSTPKDNRPSFLRGNSPEPELPAQSQLPPLQVGGFLPRYIPSAPTTTEREDPARQPYGYLCTEKDVILSLDDVQRLLSVLAEELTLRGLSTPLLFSTQALDVSAPRVRNLIRAFLGTCSEPIVRASDARFREEARFAGPHELAMTIRWGLARIVRIVNGTETHGFMDFDVYRAWRMSEESQRYPPDHFASIVPGIPPPARPIFTSLFTLLSRLVAYSTASGLTPSMLAGYFGPLIFGLVPAATATFSGSLTAFHRAAHATEHLLLSHIRWEDDTQRRRTPGTGGLPSRLKDWIRGYPATLPRSGEADLDRVRRGARTVRVASVRRNVRLYSPDLVQSAASWAGEGDLSGRAEWLRVVPKHSGLQARYTDTYRKRLDIPIAAADSRGPSSENGHGSWLSSEASSFTGAVGASGGAEDAKYSSLTDMRWGEFEALGFGGGKAEGKRLEFDLNEGARQSRLEKRTTMTWTDFSSAGFLRDDSPLSETLQFAAPLQTSIQTWPATSEDIHRKLKKQQKVLPAFGWETTPVAGQEWVVEEAFLDCWADLIWSSGWSEREERTHRDSNWAMIDFKALPTNPSQTTLLAQSADPRTSNQWFVFEEFVPREYRDQLTNPKKKRNALGFTVKQKQWKPAPTLNGKPYTSGMPPHSPGYGASEFDAMLKSSRGATRKISAGDDTTDSWHTNPPATNGTGLTISTPTFVAPAPIQTLTLTPTTPKRPPPSPRGAGSASRGLSSRFKIGSAKRGNVGSEYDPNLDFETRTASEGSDGSPDQMYPDRSFGLAGLGSPGKKHSRRQSKDDAWVDILVADQGRRMRDQDASFRGAGMGGAIAFPTGSSSTLRRGRATSDPDIQQQHLHSRITYDEEDYTTGTAPVPISPPSGYRSSDEEVMPIPREASPDPAAHLYIPNPEPAEPVAPGRPSRETQYEDDHEDFEPESDFEPTSDDHGRDHEDVTTQSFAVSDSGFRDDDLTTSSLGQPISPLLLPRRGGLNNNGDRSATAVSSLIEAYSERDAQAQSGEVKPSRLPVRATPKPPVVVDDALVAPPIPPALEPGRASPSRYIHGAPLQNVLEEEDD